MSCQLRTHKNEVFSNQCERIAANTACLVRESLYTLLQTKFSWPARLLDGRPSESEWQERSINVSTPKLTIIVIPGSSDDDDPLPM